MSPLFGPSIDLIGSFSPLINSVNAAKLEQVLFYLSASEAVNLSICQHDANVSADE